MPLIYMCGICLAWPFSAPAVLPYMQMNNSYMPDNDMPFHFWGVYIIFICHLYHYLKVASSQLSVCLFFYTPDCLYRKGGGGRQNLGDTPHLALLPVSHLLPLYPVLIPHPLYPYIHSLISSHLSPHTSPCLPLLLLHTHHCHIFSTAFSASHLFTHTLCLLSAHTTPFSAVFLCCTCMHTPPHAHLFHLPART